jgi:hypothetical protein
MIEGASDCLVPVRKGVLNCFVPPNAEIGQKRRFFKDLAPRVETLGQYRLGKRAISGWKVAKTHSLQEE